MKRLFVAIPLFALLLWGCASKPEISQDNTVIATESTIQESNDSIVVLNSDLSIEVVGGDENTLRDFITQWFIPVYSDNSIHDSGAKRMRQNSSKLHPPQLARNLI